MRAEVIEKLRSDKAKEYSKGYVEMNGKRPHVTHWSKWLEDEWNNECGKTV